MKDRFAALVRTRSQAQWCEVLEDTDVCFSPVLSLSEAPLHPHNVAPAPRVSRTPGAAMPGAARPGEHTDEVLDSWLGLTDAKIRGLRDAGAVA
jgi:alpha-methylacyl-CoA racemase